MLETGQLSVNTPIILLQAGPSCALSTGRMQEVFNHMHLTLFTNSFYFFLWHRGSLSTPRRGGFIQPPEVTQALIQQLGMGLNSSHSPAGCEFRGPWCGWQQLGFQWLSVCVRLPVLPRGWGQQCGPCGAMWDHDRMTRAAFTSYPF